MKKLGRWVSRFFEFVFRFIFSVVASFLFGTIIYVLGLFLLSFILFALDAAQVPHSAIPIIAFYNVYGFKTIFIIIFLWLMSGKDPLSW